MKTMKEEINRLVIEKGGNKAEIARKLGISPQLLGRYLQGLHEPKMNFWVSWKRAYNEDPLNLFKSTFDVAHIEKPQMMEQMFTQLQADYVLVRRSEIDENVKLLREVIETKNQTISILTENIAMLKKRIEEMERALISKAQKANQ